MTTKTTFTPSQIQKLATAFRTTCNTDWKIRTNSVTAVQAFRTVLSAFPGLLRDWNGFYQSSKQSGTTRNTRKSTRTNRTTKSRTTRKARRTTRRTKRTGTKIKRSFGTRKPTRFIKGFKRTTKRFKSRRAA